MNNLDVLELLELEEFDSTDIDDDSYSFLSVDEFIDRYYPTKDRADVDPVLFE